ncbi:BamA/TamA family outer membrane protein [Reichenbachiella sp.]
MPIPYVDYSRSTEFAYGLVPLMMYTINKKDTISPQSLTGAILMRTTNGTWMTGAFGKFFLKEDNYRVTLAAVAGNVNFQFYPDMPGAPEIIDYSTGLDYISADVQKKIAPSMYAGIGYVFTHFATDYDLEDVPTEYTSLHGGKLMWSYDKRDDVYYPKDGYLTNFNYNFYPTFFGNEESSNKITIDHNQYFSARQEKDVIAARLFVGIGIGDLVFNQQFVLGGKDLRGYSQGEFRGEQLYALQGEYRWNLTERFGLVGFAGIAMVNNETTTVDNGTLLPAAGGGFRINVFPKNHLNVGLDAAAGKGDWSISFQIGETF